MCIPGATDDGPSSWIPATHVGDSDNVSGSPGQPAAVQPSLVVFTHLKSEQTDGRSLSPSLPPSAFQINKTINT